MDKKVLLILLMLYSYAGYSQILKAPVPDKLVVFTFDDAAASHYSTVAPLLKKYGFGATFFICEFPPNFNDSSKYMNWRQIKGLHDMGFEIANHTRTHRAITRLSEEQFVEELNYIENKCDSMHIPKPSAFAYPGYGLNREVMETLEESGYTFSRAGGSRVYNPEKDYLLLIPAWASEPGNEQEIMDAFKLAKDGKIVVIIFHGVPDIEHPWVNTSQKLFEKYLDFLSTNQYKVVALRDLYNYIDPKAAKKLINPDFSRPLKN